MIVHNIGRGPQMEDELFDWKVLGTTGTTGRTQPRSGIG